MPNNKVLNHLTKINNQTLFKKAANKLVLKNIRIISIIFPTDLNQSIGDGGKVLQFLSIWGMRGYLICTVVSITVIKVAMD